MAEYRIDELAREAGTTVRNVRAYQDRGLLPPPRRVGRVGVYDDLHLARLRMIGSLLERGYTLASIGDVVRVWERGGNVRDLLGLEAAVTGPWSDETPTTMSAEALADLFGGTVDVEAVEEAVKAGVLEPEGDHFRVNSPRELAAAAELVAAGIPLSAVIAHSRKLRRDIDRVASRFVELAMTHLFDPLGDAIPPDEVPRLAEVIERLRPVAEMVVDAELARAMERHATAQLGDRLERITEHLLSRERSHEAS
jgi:DNA-binding transcriptional MerR regulator